MMELALQHNKGPVTLADISAQQSISISYLEQLFARLRQHGLVTGMRGPGGGYCLARPAAEITIASILATVDDVSRKEELPHVITSYSIHYTKLYEEPVESLLQQHS